MSKQKPKGNVVYFCIILLLVLVMIFSGLQILESTVFHKGQGEGNPIVSKTIVRDGVEYFPRQDITVVMILGIDKMGEVVDSGSYNNPGMADVISLLIFDETNKNCKILQLNRDTMMDIRVLGIGGKYAGTMYGQLALAHSYGSGLEDSCENTRDTVSQFLYGIYIDYYLSLNMGGIGIMTEKLGGVPVVADEDFPDLGIQKGDVVELRGEQATQYIRAREGIGDQTNVARMKRHRDFIEALLDKLTTKLDGDTSFALSLYDALKPYLVTDCSGNVISTLVDKYGDYEVVQIVSPEGDTMKVNGYMQFKPDKDALDQLILELFYAPK